MSDEPQPSANFAANSPGPQTAGEARWFRNGVLVGVTRYAQLMEHSPLFRDNPRLREIMDEVDAEVIGLFRRFGDDGEEGTDAANVIRLRSLLAHAAICMASANEEYAHVTPDDFIAECVKASKG